MGSGNDPLGILTPTQRKIENDDPLGILKKKVGGIKWGRGSEASNSQSQSSGVALGKFGATPVSTPDKKYKPEEVSVLNKQFEDATGYRKLELGSGLPQIAKAREEKKFLEYRKIEEYEINPVLNEVAAGTVTPQKLSNLYNKPYGKKIVGQLINEQVPEVGSMALEEDTFGNESKWKTIADAIQVKNRQQGLDAQTQYEANLDVDLSNKLNNYKLGRNLGAAETRHGGGTDEYDFDGVDTNSPEQLGKTLQQLQKSDYVVSKSDRMNRISPKELAKQVQEKLFYLKSEEPLHPEILQLNDDISAATKSVGSVGWRKQSLSPEKQAEYEQVDEQYIKAGLNYLRDANPGQYKNIMRAIGSSQKIADIDYENLVEVGKKIKNQQQFKQGEIVSDDDRDFSTYQTRRADISLATSERLKQMGYKNAGRINDKAVVKAMEDVGVDPNSEEALAIRRDEVSGGYGIVKGGGLTALARGFSAPIKSIQQTFNVIGSPVDTYLNSRRLDYGDQKVADAEGNISDVLPSERKLNSWKNVANKAVEGFGQFSTQIFLARAMGKVLEVPYNIAAMSVPRAALTGAQSTNIAAYGGGFLSTLAQTYGSSYIDFLQKTGNPDKAAFMAGIDATGQAALEVGILPDVKIAESMKGALASSRDKLAKGIMGVVERGGKVEAAKPLIRTWAEETSKILGKEVLGEEVLQNVENFFVETVFSPQTAKKRDLGEETERVIKEAGVQMALPAILGGLGNAKNNASQKFTKDALNAAAINFDKFKEALDISFSEGATSQQDYAKALDILTSHKESIENAPKRDANGELISLERQMEYAFQDTMVKENQRLAQNQNDAVQREPFEKKIAEADAVKRKIFYGEEVKGLPKEEEEEETPVGFESDQELLSTILEMSGEGLQGNDLQFFIDQAANAPQQFIEDYGTEITSTLLSRATDQQLEKALEDASQFEDSKNAPVIQAEIDKRSQSENPPIDQVRELADENTPDEISKPIEAKENVELGGGINNKVGEKGTYVLPIQEIDNLRSQKQTDLVTGNAISLEKDLTDNGIKEPLVITYYPNDGKAVLTDGHNRLDVAKDMGAERLPIRIVEKYTDAPSNAKDWTPPKNETTQPTPVNIESNEQGGKLAGSNEVYQSNDDIKKLGTEKEYDEYLDSKFPDSKIKTVLYRTAHEEGMLNPESGLIFMSPDKDYGKILNKGGGKKTVAVVVDIKNPKVISGSEFLNSKDDGSELENGKYDAIIGDVSSIRKDPPKNAEIYEVAVPSSSQVHVLGSKSDIDGFKKWKQKNETTEQQSNQEDQQAQRPTEEAGVVDEVTDTDSKQAEEPKAKFSTKAREVAAKIREKGLREALPNWAKADLPEGTKIKGFGGKFLDEAVAKAIELVADAVDAGKDLADAIKDGYAHLKDYYTQNTKSFNEQKVRSEFEANMNSLFSEDEGTMEPPPAEPTPKKEKKGSGNDKGILTHLYDATDVPQGAKDGFKSEGLKYETKSQKEAESVAKSVIEFAGIDQAVEMAEAMKFDGDVNSLIFAEALNQLAEQERKATTPEAKMEAAKRFAEVGIAYDKMARYGGRFNAAINYFYQKSPLGIVMMENAKRKDDFNQWAKGKEQSWKDFWEDSMKYPEFKAIVDDKIKEALKKERAEARQKRIAKVDKFFDDAIDKTKGGATYATIIPPPVIRAALEGMKKAYHAGESIAKVIQDAVDYISNELGSQPWDTDKFRKEWEEKLSEKVNAEELYRERLRKQIKELDEQIANRKRKPKEPKEEKEWDEETRKLIEERDKKVEILDQIVAPQDKLDRYKASLKKQISDLEEQIKEGKRKPKTDKAEPDKEAEQLAKKRDELKEELERVAPLKSTEDYKVRQLDKFRKKLKGLTEKQKDDVIRKAYKQLVENGALEYEDLRKIIAQATGQADLTAEEVERMKDLVAKTNAVEDAAQKVRDERTEESFVKFSAAEIEAGRAARDLNEIFHNKPDIIRRLTSIMQLSTLGIPALVNNPIYNIWNQMTLRAPIGLINDLIDRGMSGVAKAVGKNSTQEYNVLETQKEFFRQLGLGATEAFEQIGTGLNRQDYNAKEVYGQQIRPFQSIRDIVANWRGKKPLTRAQYWDKLIQGTVGIPAEAVARFLNLGDKPQRFAAEGAQASAFAKALGLKNMDYKIFIQFPREEAYRAYKLAGLSDEQASQKADAVAEAIVQEGKRSTFQQDNLLNDALTRAFGVLGGKESGKAQLAKTLAVSPYVKIPLNAFWSYYNLLNPEVAFLQAGIHAANAKRLKGKEELTKAKLQSREARYWLAHGIVGIAYRAAIIALVKAGTFVPGSDEEDSKKDRDASAYFDKPGYVNVGDVKISNRWFGHWGMLGNAIAKKWKDMTPEQRENQQDFWNIAFGGMELDGLKEMENGVFANSSSLLQTINTGNPDRYLLNTINMMSNIIQPAAAAQVERALLDKVPTAKGDSFGEKLSSQLAQRSVLYRTIFKDQIKYKRDIWGQEVPKDGNLLSRMFGISKSNKQVFARPIYNDFLRTNDSGFLPPAVLPTLNGQKLNIKQELKLQEYIGNERKRLAEPYVNDEAQIRGFNAKYSDLKNDDGTPDDEARKFVLQYLYDQGRDFGLEKFYMDYPEFKPKKETPNYNKEAKKDIFKSIQSLQKYNR